MKKLSIGIALILILTLLLSVFPLAVLAEDDVDDAEETTTVAEAEAEESEDEEEPDDAEEAGDPEDEEEGEDAEEAEEEDEDAEEPEEDEVAPVDVEETDDEIMAVTAEVEEPAPATTPYKDFYVGKGSTVINAVDFDIDGFYEYTMEVNEWAQQGNATYNFRPEFAEEGDGPQTEDAFVGGENIGSVCYTEPDEWLEYTINVTNAGKYLVSGWASSGSAGAVAEIYCNEELIGSFDVANEGWGNYSLYNAGIIDLEEGIYVIKTVWPNGGLNFAALVFTELYGETAAPVIDGIIDPIWNNTEAFDVDIVKVGEYSGVDGYFKVLWDEEKLYVLVVVPDTTPNHEHNDNYQKDGIEVPIDFFNTKSKTYENEGQINITFFAEGVSSEGNRMHFGNDGQGLWTGDMIDWAVTVTEEGYIYEIAFNYAAAGIVPAATIGMDMQINDNAEGTGRTACYAWNDDADQVWGNPTYMGNIKLLANGTTTIGQAPKVEEPPAPPAQNLEDDELPLLMIDDGAGSGDEPEKVNPASGDSIIFPIILIALLGIAVVTVKKVKVK
ncbi:MAG: hypothetical protein FWF92_09890 [Oscillospiraceae bacterium]|nr:hypothetical protein [Oscillospiraceae bacterium]